MQSDFIFSFFSFPFYQRGSKKLCFFIRVIRNMYLGIHLQSIIYFFLNKYFVISYSEAYVHLMLRYFF